MIVAAVQRRPIAQLLARRHDDSHTCTKVTLTAMRAVLIAGLLPVCRAGDMQLLHLGLWLSQLACGMLLEGVAA